jgi:arsenate reductase
MAYSYNILFLCTGNSARSILGEALATTLSHGRLVGYSAGSKPNGYVHPVALRMIKEMGYPLDLLKSKSWDDFGKEDAPHMDFIITVCDSAAGEECPYCQDIPRLLIGAFQILLASLVVMKKFGKRLEK